MQSYWMMALWSAMAGGSLAGADDSNPVPREAGWAWSADRGGLQLRAPENQHLLRLRGYAQFDGRTFLGDGSPADAYLLRRLRPIVEGNVSKILDYRLMLDFAPAIRSSRYNNAHVQDAFVNLRPRPEFQIQAGKFRVPVGLERIQSDQNLTFLERAYPSQLVPNRDLGAEVHGDLREGTFSYEFGIFSGQPDGTTGDLDRDSGKDFVARVFAQPFRNTEMERLRRLGFGIGATVGDRSESSPAYVSPGQKSLFRYNTGAAEDGQNWRAVPQAYYYLGPLGVLAEYAVSSTTLRLGNYEAEVRQRAWQMAVSYVLTGEDNTFLVITPRRPLELDAFGPGAWVLAARVTGLDFDAEAFPILADARRSAARAFSYTFGVVWLLNRNVRWTLDYEHSNFDARTSTATFPRREEAVLSRLQIGL